MKTPLHHLVAFLRSDSGIFHAKRFVGIFYSIGLIGFLIPLSRNYFIGAIPWSLLLIFTILMFYETNGNIRLAIACLVVAVSGFLVEMAGTRTGIIFGSYSYGDILGWKIAGTPLIIGINWVMVSVLARGVALHFRVATTVQIFMAAFILVIYDIPLEIFAIKTGMWTWENHHPPVQNFIAWAVIALIFQFFLHVYKVKIQNPLSFMVLISQILFFTLLALFL